MKSAKLNKDGGGWKDAKGMIWFKLNKGKDENYLNKVKVLKNYHNPGYTVKNKKVVSIIFLDGILKHGKYAEKRVAMSAFVFIWKCSARDRGKNFLDAICKASTT